MVMLDLTTDSSSDEDIDVFNPQYWGNVLLSCSVKSR